MGPTVLRCEKVELEIGDWTQSLGPDQRRLEQCTKSLGVAKSFAHSCLDFRVQGRPSKLERRAAGRARKVVRRSQNVVQPLRLAIMTALSRRSRIDRSVSGQGAAGRRRDGNTLNPMAKATEAKASLTCVSECRRIERTWRQPWGFVDYDNLTAEHWDELTNEVLRSRTPWDER